jgi:hypothetical protein
MRCRKYTYDAFLVYLTEQQLTRERTIVEDVLLSYRGWVCTHVVVSGRDDGTVDDMLFSFLDVQNNIHYVALPTSVFGYHTITPPPGRPESPSV